MFSGSFESDEELLGDLLSQTLLKNERYDIMLKDYLKYRLIYIAERLTKIDTDVI